MHISLTPDLQKFVKTQIQSGHYTSATEVIEEALRDKIHSIAQQKLQQRLQASREQYASGDYYVADRDFFTDTLAALHERQRLALLHLIDNTEPIETPAGTPSAVDIIHATREERVHQLNSLIEPHAK